MKSYDPDAELEPRRKPIAGGRRRPWRAIVQGWPRPMRALFVSRAQQLAAGGAMRWADAEEQSFLEIESLMTTTKEQPR